MKNLDMKVTGSKLVITVDLKKEFGKSKSGKNVIIATTEGSTRIEGTDGVVAGINIYRKPEEK